MSTLIAEPPVRPMPGASVDSGGVAADDVPDQVVALRGIGWGGYERVLDVRGDRSRPRHLYLDGDLFLMSPGHSHECDKERFGLFVAAVARVVRMRYTASGATTYRRERDEAGVEPDQSYYFANRARIAGKKDIDLNIDPPPDLAIEVVYSNSADAAVEVSRRLSIPEVWVCDERRLRFLALGPDGQYAEAATSGIFPWLEAEEILRWIRRPETEEYSLLEWEDDLVSWLRETVIPRIGAPDRH